MGRFRFLMGLHRGMRAHDVCRALSVNNTGLLRSVLQSQFCAHNNILSQLKKTQLP